MSAFVDWRGILSVSVTSRMRSAPSLKSLKALFVHGLIRQVAVVPLRGERIDRVEGGYYLHP